MHDHRLESHQVFFSKKKVKNNIDQVETQVDLYPECGGWYYVITSK